MRYRTDLAMEERQRGRWAGKIEKERKSGCRITRMELDERAGQGLSKPAGRYITIEVPPISGHIEGEDQYIEVVSEELKRLLPRTGTILVAGLGNRGITADALGPRTAEQVLATRHIGGELGEIFGEEGLRAVAVVIPDVLGNTGMESLEVIRGLTKQVQAQGIIAVDALASRELRRLGNTVQISDAGIAPGSGVQNSRPAIDARHLGIPVIGLGIPTVVEAMTLAMGLLENAEEGELRKKIEPRGTGMIVTPREIDVLIERSARLLGMSINRALNSQLSVEEFSALVN